MQDTPRVNVYCAATAWPAGAEVPTASQSVEVGQATAFNCRSFPDTLMSASCQLEPFQ